MNIDLIQPCGYHFTREEMNKIGGCFGYTGCAPPGISYPKENEKDQTLILEINCNPSIDPDMIRNWANSFTITPCGHNDSKYDYLSIYQKQNHISKKFTDYYYKKEGFDDAYSAFTKLSPSFSEKDFARVGTDPDYYDCYGGLNYNYDLIEKTSIKKDGVEPFDISTYERNVNSGNVIFYTVRITLISTDIDREDNLQTLMKILEYCSQHKYTES